MKRPHRCLAILLALLILFSSALPLSAQERKTPAKQSLMINSLPKSAQSADGLIVQNLSDMTPEELAAKLVGSGITISNVKYTGLPCSAGVFSGGKDIIGFADGIILSCGDVANVIGPNKQNDISTDLNLPGDPDLEALIGETTYDATVLEFDFIPESDTISFQYVFASDEYNEYVYEYNDVFAFFVNGVNVALIPGTDTPVAINNVNGGNPYGENPKNPEYYRNNSFPDGSSPINTEMDGLTVVLSMQAKVNAGVTNHIKLAIADALDHNLDSVVFIKAGSLSDKPAQPGTLQFSQGYYSVKESNGSIILTVNRTDGSNGQVSVKYATVEGTALEGHDFVKTSGTLVFGDGETSATITIPLLIDQEPEPPEYFKVVLSDPTGGAVLGQPYEAWVDIMEAPGLEISNTLSAVFNVTSPGSDGGGGSNNGGGYAFPPEEPAPTVTDLPEGVLIARWPGHIPLVKKAVKLTAKSSEIILEITDQEQYAKAKTLGLVPRIYYWNEKYSKWVALASYQYDQNRVKAVNDGYYTGWLAIFAVRQPNFTDLALSAWYEPVLNRANGMALLEGFPASEENPGGLDRLAKPAAPMTRSEFVAMVSRSLGLVSKDDKSMYYLLQNVEDSEAVLNKHFNDAGQIPDWARNVVASAAESGLLKGVAGMEDQFGADLNITRIEAAVIISNVLAKIPGCQFKAADFSKLNDSHLIPEWAQGKVAEGVLVGDEKGNLNPDQPLSRAEAYTLFLRLLRSLGW